MAIGLHNTLCSQVFQFMSFDTDGRQDFGGVLA
jgi:hypothetical protein